MNSNSYQSSRNNKNLQNLTISSRSYDAMNLGKFPDFLSLSQYSNLSFCHNPITSFLTLPTLPNLISLKLDHTKITSFVGANKQPQLSSISLISTPVSNYKYFFEMCLIAFGTQLIRINDKIVSSKQRKFAKENYNILNKYMCSGWIITKGGQPIHLLHYQSRKRICFYTSNQPPNQNPSEIFHSDDLSNDNIYSQISRSTTMNNEQESTTITTYASSFISDSSDISSSTTSYNPYKLDEQTREDLLTKMIKLSHEWNPPPKTKLSDKDKDNFLESSIFELFQPSMARSRRIVARDQRPENLFKRPVSIQTESPYADERKSYLLRKKEEYERRIKQKQEQLRKQQEEEEFEYEEEEEEIAEQERIKDENDMQLQDNLQEEKIKDIDVPDTNDFNKNDNEEEEEKIDLELNESPKQEEESTLNEEKVDNENKPEIKQIQPKRKSIVSIAQSSKVITTPKETESHQLMQAKSEKTIVTPQPKAQEDESKNSPLLSESEMEVFRKRRLMSMNKFILNPNSSKQNTENVDASRNVDDKIVKKRRKTLTHAKTIRYIEKPTNELNLSNESNSNNNSSTNLTQSNKCFSPTNVNKDKFTRRPTYSEIMSNRYKEQHKFNYQSSQQNKMEPSQKLQQFNLTKRKTSFAALDISKFMEANSNADTSKDKTENANENEIENIKENEIENANENEIENANENEIENTNENEIENTNENEIENTNENEIENNIENETEGIKENETKTEIESKSEFDLDRIKNEPVTQENDNDDELMDDKINSFLQAQNSEEDAEPDLEMLEEMLKDVNVDDEDDL